MRHIALSQSRPYFGNWLLLDMFVLERQSFGSDSHLLAVHSYSLDCIAQFDYLVSHANCLRRLFLYYRLKESSFGVELHVRQPTHLQQ